MATKEAKAEEANKQAAHLKQRQVLNHAFGALEGQKSIQSFNAYTFEEALNDQIELIEGESSRLRPNQLDRVKRVQEEIATAVQELKKVPPEEFLQPDEDHDVNTNPKQKETA